MCLESMRTCTSQRGIVVERMLVFSVSGAKSLVNVGLATRVHLRYTAILQSIFCWVL